jgi:hypothetical protein
VGALVPNGAAIIVRCGWSGHTEQCYGRREGERVKQRKDLVHGNSAEIRSKGTAGLILRTPPEWLAGENADDAAVRSHRLRG